MDIRSMPLSERPSVKLAYFGTRALSNRELLSLVIGNTKDKDALDLASDVLDYVHEDIGDLGTTEMRELLAVRGIGESKASAIVAAMELGRRARSAEENKTFRSISASDDVARIMMDEYISAKQEHIVVFCLNSKGEIISQSVVGIGSADYAPVHPRDVFSRAIKQSAMSIIVAHNHPSGYPAPSREDIDLTKRLLEASRIIGIQLLDHVIVGRGSYVSLKAEGYLDDTQKTFPTLAAERR